MEWGWCVKTVKASRWGTALVLCWAGMAAAQSTADLQQALDNANRLRQLEDQRQQQQLLEEKSRAPAPAQLAAPSVPAPTVQPGVCREVEHIEGEGVTLLSQRTFAEIAARYAHRCLGVSDMEALLSDITRARGGAGFLHK